MVRHQPAAEGAAPIPPRRAPCGAIYAVALLLTLAWSSPAIAHEGSALHPKDGPDADVSFVLGGDSLRATMIFNLAFLDDVLGVLREDSAYLHPAEYAGVEDALVAQLKAEHQVLVDGVPVTPVPVEFEVMDADPKLVPLFPTYGARALTQVRLVLDHPVKSPPDRIGLVWGSFPLEAPWQNSGGDAPMVVNARLAVGGDETLIAFRHDEPESTWHRDLTTSSGPAFDEVPAASLPDRLSVHLGSLLAALVGGALLLLMGAERRQRLTGGVLGITGVAALVLWPVAVIELPSGGAGDLDEARAAAVFAPLHANIYRAFDYTAESDIYDALARSVDGELLGDLYDQVYRGLVMAEHGGAVCRVQEVRPVSVEVEQLGALPGDDAPGFSVRAVWQVDGIVRHWGHSHWRTNEHEGRYTVAARDGGWRIVGSTMLDQKRIAGSPIEEGPAAPEPPPFQELVLPPGSDL
jgi:hypothetical protein